VTVPHCYPSVVLNTLETSIKVGVWVEVKFVITGEGAHVAMRSGTEVNCTSGTEVTSIVTGNMGMMGSDAVFETMGSAMDSVPLINFRETMGTRGCNVDVGSVRRSGSRDGGKTGTRSYVRTSSRSIAMTTFVTPFTTIVARAVEGGPERL